ncbi:MAG: hypothetical protein ACI9XO_000493 [Paraglaciecola sp.]|jgi:hypothetical protein
MELRNFFNNISKEEIERINQEQIRENEGMFKDFQEAFKKDCCVRRGYRKNTC